jgi:hypothetical protein
VADGVVSLDANSGTITYSPGQAYSGMLPAFQYTVTDASGTTSHPAAVSIAVLAISIATPAAGVASDLTVVPQALFLVLIGMAMVTVARRRRSS